jgi:type VI protein secretion system component VasK
MREQEGLSMTSRWLDCAYRSLCFAAAIILVLVIAYSHMTNTQMLTERASRLELSMDGTAEEPFAHRLLLLFCIIISL